jgi:hypothetical protein
LLALEDLSGWRPGADPGQAAGLLAQMHRHWEGEAQLRWPWLRPVGAGAELVQQLFGRNWPELAARADLPPPVQALGEQLARPGRVVAAEDSVGLAGPVTRVHGDASTQNMRTGPGAEIALLDWEDVSAAPGALDLAWLLVSSVAPERWDEVIAAYGPAARLTAGLTLVMPSVAVQGLLSMADTALGSADALAWGER